MGLSQSVSWKIVGKESQKKYSNLSRTHQNSQDLPRKSKPLPLFFKFLESQLYYTAPSRGNASWSRSRTFQPQGATNSSCAADFQTHGTSTLMSNQTRLISCHFMSRHYLMSCHVIAYHLVPYVMSSDSTPLPSYGMVSLWQVRNGIILSTLSYCRTSHPILSYPALWDCL